MGELEPAGEIGSDLGALDNLSLDDVDLNVDLGDEGETPPASGAAPAAKIPSGPAVQEIKTDWVKSDAPPHPDPG